MVALIGSGEMALPMRRVHRALIDRLAKGSGRPASEVRATVIDTPYGFQSNADALTAEAVNFFAAQFGVRASVASLRRADDDVLADEVAAAHIRDADHRPGGRPRLSVSVRSCA